MQFIRITARLRILFLICVLVTLLVIYSVNFLTVEMDPYILVIKMFSQESKKIVSDHVDILGSSVSTEEIRSVFIILSSTYIL